jgi:hypothetical protein
MLCLPVAAGMLAESRGGNKGKAAEASRPPISVFLFVAEKASFAKAVHDEGERPEEGSLLQSSDDPRRFSWKDGGKSMSSHRGKLMSVEFDPVTCGNCAKQYPGRDLKPLWQGETVQWTCPACGSIHDGMAQGENRIVFRLRPGIQP